jgi:hypothetical protein
MEQDLELGSIMCGTRHETRFYYVWNWTGTKIYVFEKTQVIRTEVNHHLPTDSNLGW